MKFEGYQDEINAKEEEIAAMRARLHHKAEELKVAEIGALTNLNKAQVYNNHLQDKDQEISKLKDEIQELKQKLIETQATRKSEGTALLEIEHVKADNDRLIKLLQKTNEYKSFGKFAEDNTGSVRYIPSTKTDKCYVKD